MILPDHDGVQDGPFLPQAQFEVQLRGDAQLLVEAEPCRTAIGVAEGLLQRSEKCLHLPARAPAPPACERACGVGWTGDVEARCGAERVGGTPAGTNEWAGSAAREEHGCVSAEFLSLSGCSEVGRKGDVCSWDLRLLLSPSRPAPIHPQSPVVSHILHYSSTGSHS